MLKETLKIYFLDYIIFIIITSVLYSFFGINALVVGVGLLIIFRVDSQTNYLRKMIRIYQLHNDARVMALMKRLKVSTQDAKSILEEQKSKASDKQWEQIEKDFKDISN